MDPKEIRTVASYSENTDCDKGLQGLQKTSAAIEGPSVSPTSELKEKGKCPANLDRFRKDGQGKLQLQSALHGSRAVSLLDLLP